MIKRIGLVLCALLLLCSLCACSSKRDTQDLSCQDIVEAFSKAYAASYAPNVSIPDELLGSEFGLNLAQMEDYYGEMPQIGLRCDRIVAVKAKKGEVKNIVKCFEEAQKSFLKNTMEYSNSQKVSAARILTQGNFVCFYMLGDDYGGEDLGEGSAQEVKFYEQQQQIGEDCWHNIFFE